MTITYDHSEKLAGLGIVPWTRLGLEQYFDQYEIISLHNWDLPETLNNLHVKALSIELPVNHTSAMVKQPEFQKLITSRYPNYKLTPYKPVETPNWLPESSLIQTSKKYTRQFENKRSFREYFEGKLPFPVYKIINKYDLPEDWHELMQGQGCVLQDEKLSGGRGTFIIDSQNSYETALKKLAGLSKEEYVVVSELIEPAVELSLQCCVTKGGIFIGPPQRQLVRDPLLCNPNDVRGEKFCGAQVSSANDLPEAVVSAMRAAAQTIGEGAKREGYCGIFGVDFLVQDNNVYVLEMNARITGVTPLLTMCATKSDIPFFLLHVLELGKIAYEIEESAVQNNYFSCDASMLILHAKNTYEQAVQKTLGSGVYEWKNQELKFLRSGAHFQQEDEGQLRLLIQQWAPKGSTVKPGGRLLVAFAQDKLLDEAGRLTKNAASIVEKLYREVSLATDNAIA